MDGLTFVLLLVFGALLYALAGGGRRRRDDLLGKRHGDRIDRELYRTTHTDVTGVLRCRRCGADGAERAGVCPRCGAPL